MPPNVKELLRISRGKPMTKPIPTLHGDGIHDDTAGFEALINGTPFEHGKGFFAKRVGDHVTILGGRFHLKGVVYCYRKNIFLKSNLESDTAILYYDATGDNMLAWFKVAPSNRMETVKMSGFHFDNVGLEISIPDGIVGDWKVSTHDDLGGARWVEFVGDNT